MFKALKKAIDEEIDGAANYFGLASELEKMGIPYYITKYIYKIAEDELRHAERLEKIARSIERRQITCKKLA